MSVIYQQPSFSDRRNSGTPPLCCLLRLWKIRHTRVRSLLLLNPKRVWGTAKYNLPEAAVHRTLQGVRTLTRGGGGRTIVLGSCFSPVRASRPRAVLFCGLALAQSEDRIEVFDGYSYLNPDSSLVSPNSGR